MLPSLNMQTLNTAHVVMEQSRFEQIFGFFPKKRWNFTCMSPSAFHADVVAPGEALLIDADLLGFPGLANSVGPNTVVLMEQNDIVKMINLMRVHEELHHVLCFTGTYFYEQLLKLLDQLGHADPSCVPLRRMKNIQSETLLHYRQKTETLNRIRDFVSATNSFRDLPHTAVTAASELIMNAVFDAPIDRANGEAKYAHLPRTEDVKLKDDEIIDVSYGSDDRSFALSVKDQFGSLDRAKIVSNLYRYSKQSEDQIRKSPGGAGVGLYMLLNLCSQLDIYIQPGKSTEVIATITASRRQKDYEMQGAAINIFVNGV